jgi:hypothetical protein
VQVLKEPELRKRFYYVLVVCLCVLTENQAVAWNNIGHMAVAYVAWQNLSPALRTRVSTLVKANPKYSEWSALIPASVTGSQRKMYLFMIASTWADQIKGDLNGFPCNGLGNTDTPPANESLTLNVGYSDQCMHKYWHFIDESISSDNTPPNPVPTPNVEVKVDFFRQALHTKESKLLKSYDLVWLEHLVGDIHQPLHCVTRNTRDHPTGDQGGNKVVLTDPQKELHAFWDDVLGNKTSNLYTDAMLAEQVGKSLPATSAVLAADSAIADWMQESVKDAQDDVYVNPPIGPEWGPAPGQRYTITTAYQNNAVSMARDRVSLAGVRLANLIQIAMR